MLGAARNQLGHGQHQPQRGQERQSAACTNGERGRGACQPTQLSGRERNQGASLQRQRQHGEEKRNQKGGTRRGRRKLALEPEEPQDPDQSGRHGQDQREIAEGSETPPELTHQLLVAKIRELAPETAYPYARSLAVDEASPSGKGVVGGALLGAELVLVTEAAFKVKPTWAYIVGGLAGGAAGGVGGYFIERETSARVPMLMLAGGLAFAIPTVVAVLSSTAYEPPADYLQDAAPADEPLADPPAPNNMAPAPAPIQSPAAVPPADAAPPPPVTAPTPAPTGRRYLRSERRLSLKLPPPALFGVQDARLALGVPNVAVVHTFTRAERMMFNAPDVTEVRIPVLDVAF
jgi:hypothetical protein